MLKRPLEFFATTVGSSDVDLIAVSTLPWEAGIIFKLEDLPAEKITAWEDLYEEVKLSGVKVTWLAPSPQVNNDIPVNAAGTPGYFVVGSTKPTMYAHMDPDDATFETADQMQQIARRKIWRAGRGGSLFFRPKIQQLVSGTLFRAISSPWLDTQNPDSLTLPHFAFKYAIDRSTITWPSAGALESVAPDTTLRTGGHLLFTYYVTCRKTVVSVPPA